jgi:hypothetical protein
MLQGDGSGTRRQGLRAQSMGSGDTPSHRT